MDFINRFIVDLTASFIRFFFSSSLDSLDGHVTLGLQN